MWTFPFQKHVFMNWKSCASYLRSREVFQFPFETINKSDSKIWIQGISNIYWLSISALSINSHVLPTLDALNWLWLFVFVNRDKRAEMCVSFEYQFKYALISLPLALLHACFVYLKYPIIRECGIFDRFWRWNYIKLQTFMHDLLVVNAS